MFRCSCKWILYLFSSLVVLIQVSIRSCSFYVSISLLSSPFLFEGRDGWDLAFVCANLLAHGKNLSFCFPCAAVFLCTTFPTCTIISWFLQGVSWTGRRRLWFLRCLALILCWMFNCNQFKLALSFSILWKWYASKVE